MKNLYKVGLNSCLTLVLTIAGLVAIPQSVNAQSASMQASATESESCSVTSDSGGFIVNESAGTVMGGFVVSGDEDCEAVQMSIAVWLCDSEDCLPIASQEFDNANTDTFTPSSQRQTISADLPASTERCYMQVDLVRGDQRGANDSAQYGERRLIGAVLPNPACKEVEVVTETEEVVREVEVPVEVVREVEVPVKTAQTTSTPKELPRTGTSALAIAPLMAGSLIGGGHFAVKRFLRYIRGY